MTPLSRPLVLAAVAALGALYGCVTVPEGPSMMVLPGTGKSFDQFRADDFDCRQFASGQVGGASANQAAVDSGVKSAVVGTAIGAAAGAAINGSSGAGVGAGAGLALGALAGTGAAQSSSYGLQRRYDTGYAQCMYAKGHRVPVAGRFNNYQSRQQAYYPPPPPPAPPPSPPSYR
jgi:hypothetical protein